MENKFLLPTVRCLKPSTQAGVPWHGLRQGQEVSKIIKFFMELTV